MNDIFRFAINFKCLRNLSLNINASNFGIYIMSEVQITIYDSKKTEFILELLNNFNFVSTELISNYKVNKHDFFKSKGIWKNRNINSVTLRESAWNRQI